MGTVTLANEHWQLVVDPEQGVNVMAGYLHQDGEWLAVMPDARRAETALQASSFVLVPYSNRIEDGRFTFAGETHQLANGERHASHGDVRGRPWQIQEQSAGAITCTIDSRDFDDSNWPWPFTATVTYALIDKQVHSELSVTNLGQSAMPAGLGWHPYYNRTLTEADEPVYLHFQVESVYPDANDNRIPSGPAEPLAPNQDFRRERVLAPANFIDACFHGYDGGGTIAWPASNVRLHYHASANCGHLILYNPAKPYFAVEPVTNANNGVNLLAAGDPTSGIEILEPRATMRATFTVQALP